ncbi:MAG: hypothetical protein ABW171_13975 [Steroidobacter sp.]
MARLNVVRVMGAMVLSAAVLTGCASAPPEPVQKAPTTTQQAKAAMQTKDDRQDRTPAWMKYKTSSSRIARPTDGHGRPISADMVISTDSNGLYDLPSVTTHPCTNTGKGC